MDASRLNTQLTKIFGFMVFIWITLTLVNIGSQAAINVDVHTITLALLLILGVVLSIAYISGYILALRAAYKHPGQFAVSWGSNSETALEDAYRFDNTLLLIACTTIMVMFFVYSWIVFGAYLVILLTSLVVSIRILILPFAKGGIEDKGGVD